MEKIFVSKKHKNVNYFRKEEKLGTLQLRKSRLNAALFELNASYMKMIMKTKSIYLSKENIKAKVLEISNDNIILKCLINEEEKIFQKRIFDIEPFTGLKINQNDYIDISILTKTGERKFSYTKNSKGYSDIFDEKENFFKGLDKIDFFKPSTSNEDNI